MLRQACRLHVELRTNFITLCNKRFKGHSHWQNTKHIKGEKDRQRSLLITSYLRKMNGVIFAKNGDANPATNALLASLLDQAKKDNVPAATLENFLLKVKTNAPVETRTFFRTPLGIVLGVTYDGKRETSFRQGINKVKSRNRFELKETNKVEDVYTKKGVIVSKAPSVDITDAKVEEDAIIAGAEEFEAVESSDKSEKVFQFITLQEDMWQVVKSLREMGWTIYENRLELVPILLVELSEAQAEKFRDIYTQIENLPEVDSVIANVA